MAHLLLLKYSKYRVESQVSGALFLGNFLIPSGNNPGVNYAVSPAPKGLLTDGNSPRSILKLMADPFDSARRKIQRAEKHFVTLHEEVLSFTQLRPYETVIEPHPDKPDHTLQKIKLTQPLPPSIADATGEIVQNLRSALDNAAYAVAVGAGMTDPKNCAFPFARNLANIPSSIGRSKDLPKEIQSLFVGFQPFRGGNDLLWALNEMCNADKHKMVLPIGTAVWIFEGLDISVCLILMCGTGKRTKWTS